MDSDDDMVVALAVVAANLNGVNEQRSRRRRRKTWAAPWLLRRPQYGAYETLLTELAENNDNGRSVHNFLRMEMGQFETLCAKIGPSIARVNTNMRQCISARERMAITLRFLASGKCVFTTPQREY